LPKMVARNVLEEIKKEDHVIHTNAQFTVIGHLGADGLLVLSPVDVELEIEVGKRSKLLNMVVGDVLGKVRQAKLAIKEEIVQFTVSGHLGVDGPLALSPVDVELEIEVGKRSKLLNMVVGDVLGKVRQAKLAIKEEIVQLTVSGHLGADGPHALVLWTGS